MTYRNSTMCIDRIATPAAMTSAVLATRHARDLAIRCAMKRTEDCIGAIVYQITIFSHHAPLFAVIFAA